MKKKKILIVVILFMISVLVIVLMLCNISKIKQNKIKQHTKNVIDKKKKQVKEEPLTNLEVLTNYKGQAYLIVDRKKDKIILKHNEHMQISPASLTKLYLIDYVNTFCSLDEEVLVTREVLNTVKKGSSLAYLRLKKYSIRNLYEALLLPSGNDAAYVLAVYAGSKLDKNAKTVKEKMDALLKGLNIYLKENHYDETVIYNPSGFDYSTKTSASDLKKLTDKLLKIDWFRYLTRQDTYRATLPDGTYHNFKTANEFLDKKSKHYHPNVSGTKTGSIRGAFNIVTLYNKYNKEFLVISLGSSGEDSRYVDTRVLLSIIDNNKSLAK